MDEFSAYEILFRGQAMMEQARTPTSTRQEREYNVHLPEMQGAIFYTSSSD
jgi:hypothetical protein